jgi:hypothetical protein
VVAEEKLSTAIKFGEIPSLKLLFLKGGKATAKNKKKDIYEVFSKSFPSEFWTLKKQNLTTKLFVQNSMHKKKLSG